MARSIKTLYLRNSDERDELISKRDFLRGEKARVQAELVEVLEKIRGR